MLLGPGCGFKIEVNSSKLSFGPFQSHPLASPPRVQPRQLRQHNSRVSTHTALAPLQPIHDKGQAKHLDTKAQE